LPTTPPTATFPAILRPARFLFLPILCALAGLARGAESIPPLKFEQRALPNGLQLIWLEDHSAPSTAIQVWYRVGSKDDPPGRSGFAHLFEHMMFKSTKRMPAEFFDRLTEDVGGENNAYTADDVTVFHETVPSNNLERLLWAEAERLRQLTVDVHNFTLERAVVEEEYRQRVLAEPYGEWGEFIQKKSFAEHPYKRPTIGNIEELEASKIDEVRDFHTTFYRPDNAVLVVVGDFEPAQLQKWVDEYFGAIPKPDAPIPRVTTKESPRSSPPPIIDYDPKVPLPALAVTYLGPSITAADAPALRVMEQVLSGGESSRLYRKLVYETQLAQSAEFSADLRADLGLLTFDIILASGAPMEKVKTVFFGEIKKISDKPISDEELTIARNQLLAAKLIERETFEGKAAALGEAAAVYGDPNRVNTDLGDLQAVTPAQVEAAAQKYFTPANTLVLECLPEAMKSKGKAKK
jgi:zinc protease